jgi:methylated-DNA-[protein]-cysteine S-methyltransferase
MTALVSTLIDTPLGKVVASANTQGLCELDFADEAEYVQNGSNPYLDRLRVELAEYFAGKRREFAVLLAPKGTPFQIGVWETLRKIPYGQTMSYAAEAELLGRASAVRAVASANGKNPISILIPCHRVIAKDGSIGGYSGGIWRKEFLLTLEKSYETSGVSCCTVAKETSFCK